MHLLDSDDPTFEYRLFFKLKDKIQLIGQQVQLADG